MRIAATFIALTLIASPSLAATDQECQSLWKTVDVDANGSLSRSEDTGGYIASVQKSGGKLLQSDTLSRDEFLTYCKTGFATASTPSPANTKDLGKGDLTPGTHPLSREDALKKLEASGFKDVRDLKLDDKGIWRASAFADGKMKPLAVDEQGDIVAETGNTTPQSNSMSNEKAQSPNASSAQPTPAEAGPTTSTPAQTGTSAGVKDSNGSSGIAVAEPANPSLAPETSMDTDSSSSGELVQDGSGSRSGLYVWLFILIGNAISLLVLNGVGGPTSAMSDSSLTRAERL